MTSSHVATHDPLISRIIKSIDSDETVSIPHAPTSPFPPTCSIAREIPLSSYLHNPPRTQTQPFAHQRLLHSSHFLPLPNPNSIAHPSKWAPPPSPPPPTPTKPPLSPPVTRPLQPQLLPNPHQRLHQLMLKPHPMSRRRGEPQPLLPLRHRRVINSLHVDPPFLKKQVRRSFSRARRLRRAQG